MQTFTLRPGANFATVLANLLAFLHRLPEMKAWTITVKAYSKPRTNPQNAALFGVAYPPLMEYVGLDGDEDRQQLHREMCGRFFGWRQSAWSPGTPEELQFKRPLRTTTKDENGNPDILSPKQFSEFYDFVQRFGAEWGVYIPDPDPMLREVA